jgi:hypothetical protein
VDEDSEGVAVGLGGSEITGRAAWSASIVTAGGVATNGSGEREEVVTALAGEDGNTAVYKDGVSGVIMCDSVVSETLMVERSALEDSEFASGAVKSTGSATTGIGGCEIVVFEIAVSAFEVSATEVGGAPRDEDESRSRFFFNLSSNRFPIGRPGMLTQRKVKVETNDAQGCRGQGRLVQYDGVKSRVQSKAHDERIRIDIIRG